MIQTKKFFLTFIVVILAFCVSWADVYKWVDENGVVHYTDTPPGDITEWEDAEEATPTEDRQQNIEPQRPEYNPEAITELLNKLDDETGNDEEDEAPSVDLYVTSWCPYCKKAKSFFRSKGIEFTEYNIERDKSAARRMRSLTQSRAVPFAVVNGHQIQGYSTAAYEQALKN